jgi:hypothetical protein
MFRTACDSASITSVCQNGRLSALSSNGETEKSWVGWGQQSRWFMVKNSLVKEEV